MALALATGGCTKWMYGHVLFPDPERPASAGWAVIETDHATFNGDDVDFRLLVGAQDGGIAFDRRFIPNANIDLKALQDCDAGTLLPLIVFDYIFDRPTAYDVVELRAGEWFGAEEQFPVTIQHEDAGPPADCVDVTFLFHPQVALNPEVVFHVRANYVRPDTDAGVP
ncbi:MAG TPA: hypothetical protein VND93_27250 [Myxococcales bacterium]|nr:hypothetical protein [Myxococcales bacterium]